MMLFMCTVFSSLRSLLCCLFLSEECPVPFCRYTCACVVVFFSLFVCLFVCLFVSLLLVCFLLFCFTANSQFDSLVVICLLVCSSFASCYFVSLLILKLTVWSTIRLHEYPNRQFKRRKKEQNPNRQYVSPVPPQGGRV